MRSVLDMCERAEIFVLCPDHPFYGERSRIHDTVRQREPVATAHDRGIHRELIIEYNDLSLAHVGKDFRYDIAPPLYIKPAQHLGDYQRRDHQPIERLNSRRELIRVGAVGQVLQPS